MISNLLADDPPAPGVDDGAAVNPPVAGAMLGDVGEPNPIRPIGGEPALHQIITGGGVGSMPALTAMTHAVTTGIAHEA